MSLYWNERTRNLVPYVPGEQPRDRKFVKLNTNENPYAPSPLVIEAIQKAAGENLRLYPDPACTEFREAAAARYGIRADEVFAGNGSDEVLAFAFAAFFRGRQEQIAAGREENISGTENGPSLLFPDISYSFYPVYADLWNIPFRAVPLEEDFSINAAAYEKTLSLSGPAGIIIANPNAPTGMAIPLRDIAVMAKAAERQRSVFIVDEAYIAFTEGEGMGTALPLLKEFPNLLIIRTLSKEACLAGLRVGFAMGRAELTEGLCRIKDSFNSYPLDRLALAGAIAALGDKEYYDEVNRLIISTRKRVSSELKALGFRVLPSQANFLFAAPPPGEMSCREFFSALRVKGILVRHFNKPRIDGFLRISIGTDGDMDALLDACRSILRDRVRTGK